MKKLELTSHGLYFYSGKTRYKITVLSGGDFMVENATNIGILSSDDKARKMKEILKKV